MSACPACHYFDSRVSMTRRLRNGWVRRWRACQREECGTRWSTYEVPQGGIDTEHIDPERLREITPGGYDDE